MNELCIRELAELIGGELQLGAMPPLGGEFEPVRRIVTDSREISEGDLFWGLAGSNHDGSHFAEEAFLRGAAGAVVSGRALEPLPGKYSIQVDDSHCALWQLAIAVRKRSLTRFIGVAGNGLEATTVRMIEAVLSWDGHSSPSILSETDKNDRPSLSDFPLALANLPSECETALFSISGENSESELETCQPKLVVLCDLDAGDVATAQSMQRMLDSLPAKGRAIINGDDPNLQRLNLPANVIRAGRGTECELRAELVVCEESQVTFSVDGHQFRLATECREHVVAAVMAITVGKLFELSPEQIAAGLARFEPAPRRLQHLSGVGRWDVIDDTLESGANSLRMALAHLRDFVTSRSRVLVMDDSSLGISSNDEQRAQLGRLLVTHFGFELLVLCGRSADVTAQAATNTGMPNGHVLVSSNADEIEAWLTNHPLVGEGGLVLIKGNTELARQLIYRLTRYASDIDEKDSDNKQLNTTGDSARDRIVEVLPFASVLRETDASLPPG